MGATVFFTTAFGKTAEDAFENAVEDAEYHHGKAGYTGTIAEKTSFEVIPAGEHKRQHKRKYARQLIEEDDRRVSSKWGPAGAINIDGTKEGKRVRASADAEGRHGSAWLFFGWAST
jgi:hypothetical protein